MGNRFLSQSLRCVALLAIFFTTQQTHTMFEWGDVSLTNTTINDENFDLSGVNCIECLNVNATVGDIIINVVADTIMRAKQTVLNVTPGNTITFQVQNNLAFEPKDDEHVILVMGGGAVKFEILGDKKVAFQKTSAGIGDAFLEPPTVQNNDGTRVFISTIEGTTDLVFDRFDTGDDLSADVEIVVGEDSFITFITDNPGVNQSGQLDFEPINSADSTGRMILRLRNGALIDITTYETDSTIESVSCPIDTNDPKLLTTPVADAIAVLAIGNNPQNAHSGLLVINENERMSRLHIDPFCDFKAFRNDPNRVRFNRFGFILGPNSNLQILNNNYLDYVGTATNQCSFIVPEDVFELTTTCLPDGTPVFAETFSVVVDSKERNPSALIVDGFDFGDAETNFNNTALFTLLGDSAVYFRSGVGQDGTVSSDFSVTADNITRGIGNIVFDVEGALNVVGTTDGVTALNVLSMVVEPTGGEIKPRSGKTYFPRRTFEQDGDGNYVTYNSGSFMINNIMRLFNTSLLHTDITHQVFEKNSPQQSEPTYVGGESYYACNQKLPRPTIHLINSSLDLVDDAAFVGVDILTALPLLEFDVEENVSQIKFYNNGFCIDQGSGRHLNLGTDVGSTTCDCNLISKDAHLDVMQGGDNLGVVTQLPGVSTQVLLTLDTCPSSTCFVEGVPDDITSQPSVHTIYLAHGSNVSVGTPDPGSLPTVNNSMGAPVDIFPTLCINSNFMSFETQGGSIGLPELSGTIGEGAIFVDYNGIFKISGLKRAHIATMVVKNLNGEINLPKECVSFDKRVGVTDWCLDLNVTQTIVTAGQCFSDYTIDWVKLKKDYCDDSGFIPYIPDDKPFLPCGCPAVTEENITSLPTIVGTVKQLQIKRSRLGDPAHIMVDGGHVRELVFLCGWDSAEQATGVVVLQNDGRVGLGSAHRNVDSLQASITLGLGGVTIIPNGDGIVEVNEDLLIHNICHVVPGPDFGANGEQKLTFRANSEREIRVKSGGILDLSRFITPNQVVEFAGSLKLIFEPGSQLVLGDGRLIGASRGKLIFTDQSQLVLERRIDNQRPTGTSLSSTDDTRVAIIGTADIIMEEDSLAFVDQDTILSIETGGINCGLNTDIHLILNDQARFMVGSNSSPGGAFQVGDTFSKSFPAGFINFTLTIDGPGALFEINRQGFVGLGVGIVDKQSQIANEWLVQNLLDVNSITINATQGTFNHRQITAGDNPKASLLAFGAFNSGTFTFSHLNSQIRGGGNLALINASTPINPVVEEFDGLIDATLSVGVMSSRPLLEDSNKSAPVTAGTPGAFFDYLKITPYETQSTKRAAIAQNRINDAIEAFVDAQTGDDTLPTFGRNIIRREVTEGIFGSNAQYTGMRLSLEIGSVGIALGNSIGFDGLREATSYQHNRSQA